MFRRDDGANSEKIQHICGGSAWRYGLILTKADAGKKEEWKLQDKSHAKEGETPTEVTEITIDSSILGCYAVSTSRNIPRNLNPQQHPWQNLQPRYCKNCFYSKPGKTGCCKAVNDTAQAIQLLQGGMGEKICPVKAWCYKGACQCIQVCGLLATLSVYKPRLLNLLSAGKFGKIRSACGQMKFNKQNKSE